VLLPPGRRTCGRDNSTRRKHCYRPVAGLAVDRRDSSTRRKHCYRPVAGQLDTTPADAPQALSPPRRSACQTHETNCALQKRQVLSPTQARGTRPRLARHGITRRSTLFSQINFFPADRTRARGCAAGGRTASTVTENTLPFCRQKARERVPRLSILSRREGESVPKFQKDGLV
jgi:hypothetical protein